VKFGRWILAIVLLAAVATSSSSARPEDTDATLFAVDLKTGDVSWQVRPPVTGLPWVNRADGKHLQGYGFRMGGSCAGPFWNLVFDAATGEELAQTRAMGSRDQLLRRSSLDPVTVGGLTFTTRSTPNANGLVRIEARTAKHQLRWRRPFRVSHLDKLTAGSGVVVVEFRQFFSTRDVGHIFTMDAKSGRVLWQRTSVETAQRLISQDVSVGDRRVYVAATVTTGTVTAGNLRALAARTGHINWQRSISPSTLLGAGGGFVAVARDSASQGFDAAHGRPTWTGAVPASDAYGRSVVIGSTAFVPVNGSFDGCS
jgi:outer membrane protein assembly factor BamB